MFLWHISASENYILVLFAVDVDVDNFVHVLLFNFVNSLYLFVENVAN